MTKRQTIAMYVLAFVVGFLGTQIILEVTKDPAAPEKPVTQADMQPATRLLTPPEQSWHDSRERHMQVLDKLEGK